MLSLLLRTRNQDVETQNQNTTTKQSQAQQTEQQTTTNQTQKTIISIYSIFPPNKGNTTPDMDITITFNNTVSLANFDFHYTPALSVKETQYNKKIFELKNLDGFKPNTKYKVTITAKKNIIFRETMTNKYDFTFTTVNSTYSEIINKSAQ